MIKKKCFENNWIISKYKELKADPILIEKAIYAFELRSFSRELLLMGNSY